MRHNEEKRSIKGGQGVRSPLDHEDLTQSYSVRQSLSAFYLPFHMMTPDVGKPGIPVSGETIPPAA